MKLYFKIEKLPSSSEQYRLATDIEGSLKLVTKHGKILFDAEGILLIELAIFCRRWLEQKEKESFYYASMDFEEEPILAFNIESAEYCSFSSVWENFSKENIPICEVKDSMNDYIQRLKDNLKEKFQINVEGYEGL